MRPLGTSFRYPVSEAAPEFSRHGAGETWDSLRHGSRVRPGPRDGSSSILTSILWRIQGNFFLKIFVNQIAFCWGWEFSMWRQLVQMPTQQRSKVSEKEKRRDWKKLSANIVYSPQYRCQNWGSLVVNLRTSVAGHGNLLYRGPKTVSVKRRAKSSGTNIDLWPKLC